MATWAHWIESILGQGNWEVHSLPEAPAEPFPFERRKALAGRKPIRSRLESLLPIPIRKKPERALSALLGNLSKPEKVSFKRIDLPVSAFLLFARDPEAYFQHYEMGMPTREKIFSLEVKEEEEKGAEEELTRAQFGTRVHQILEQALLRRLTSRGIDALVFRFTQELGEAERGEMLELTRSFIQSGEAKEILTSKSFHPELPFSLRLPHGLVQGTMDLLYQKPAGDWVILDYKTSQVTPETVSSQGEEYRSQMELYALAVWKILGTPPAEARIHFLRAGISRRIVFSPEGMEGLYGKFARLQEEILAYRLTRTFPDKFWSGQKKATE